MKRSVIEFIAIFVLAFLLMFPIIKSREEAKLSEVEPTIEPIVEVTVPPTEAPTEEPTEPPTEPPITYKVIDVPEKYSRKDFKSYMDWRIITLRTSPHYKLQNLYAYTAEDGIRMVEGRYCIALGSYFTKTIGQYVDVVLENGTIIHCILGDQKSDAHTDAAHIAHPDGSIVEFIIDKKLIDPLPRRMGSMSYAYEEWRSPVVQIIVYDINYFDIIETKDAV